MRSQNCLKRRRLQWEEKRAQKLMAEKKAKWPGSCRVTSPYDDFISSATARFTCPLSEIVRTRRDFVDPAETRAVFHALPAERRWGERQNGWFFIAKNKRGQFTPETPTRVLRYVTKKKRNSLTPRLTTRVTDFDQPDRVVVAQSFWADQTYCAVHRKNINIK